MISDWEGLDRITSPPGANYTYSVQAGISASIDMVSLSFSELRPEELMSQFAHWADNGSVQLHRVY